MITNHVTKLNPSITGFLNMLMFIVLKWSEISIQSSKADKYATTV